MDLVKEDCVFVDRAWADQAFAVWLSITMGTVEKKQKDFVQGRVS